MKCNVLLVAYTLALGFLLGLLAGAVERDRIRAEADACKTAAGGFGLEFTKAKDGLYEMRRKR